MKYKVTKGSRGQPEQSRKAILDAASVEFASAGYDGARIDSIAQSAKVNKALLYYYFQDKEGIYGAVLDDSFRGLLDELIRVLDTDKPAGYKMLAYALTHFDYVTLHPHYRRLVQHEMMRAGAGNSKHFPRLVETFFRPLLHRVVETIEDGIRKGEFRRVQPMHFVNSMIAVVVFYFTAVPVIRAVSGRDPLSSEALALRRETMLDFIGGALFVDHAQASRVLAEVLAQNTARLIQSGSTGKERSIKGRKKSK
jgi:TetR/AcrR family transcriptional regulator